MQLLVDTERREGRVNGRNWREADAIELRRARMETQLDMNKDKEEKAEYVGGPKPNGTVKGSVTGA